jgi:hypothetical protein
MTLENINDRSQQSSRFSDYMLQNPSNNTVNINTCFAQPGLVCRSLHAKTNGDVVDNETLLLRGVHSTPAEPHREPEPEPVHNNKVSKSESESMDSNILLKEPFMGEMSRLTKACSEVYDFTNRLQTTHIPVSMATYPLMSNNVMFGENTRNTAKYGGKIL